MALPLWYNETTRYLVQCLSMTWRRVFTALWLWGAVVAVVGVVAWQPSSAQAQTAVATDIRVAQYKGATRFVLTLDRAVAFEVFSLAGPYRAVIDLPEIGWRLPSAPLPNARGLFKKLRYGLFRPGQTRIVLDLSKPFVIERAFKLKPDADRGHRLVLDLRPADPDSFQAGLRQSPIRVDASTFAAAQKSAEETVPIPSSVVAPLSKPAVKASVAAPTQPSLQASFSLPPAPRKPLEHRQRAVVVLDPGHGGVDPGTIGASGSYEKHITLAMARALRDALEATGRYKVVMTRDRDVFIRLRDRVQIARNASADLFISLHADSIGNKKISGPSVYTLSENASDKEAAALAEKENKVDLLAGVDLSDAPPDVANILLDLTQRETMNQSARFATTMIGNISKVAKPLRNTHRFAGFAVLKAHDVPSVLLEMGFLSSTVDEKRLKSKTFRRKFAAAIQKSVDSYFSQVQQANRP